MDNWIRAPRTLLLAMVLLILGGSQSAVSAHSQTGIPYHVPGGMSCFVDSLNRRVVRALPPLDMRSITGAIENVRWSPDLFRWDGTAWVKYDPRAPWFLGAANSGGLLPQNGTLWWDGVYSLRNWDYSSLPRGSYAVKEYYGWDANGTGTDHTGWSVWNGYGVRFCTFS